MESEALIKVRAALKSASNTTGGDTRTTLGGNEVQKIIDDQVVDAFNSKVDVSPLLAKRAMNQVGYLWNITAETSSGSGVANSSFSVYTEGSNGTPQPTTKYQLYATVKSYRTDYELTNLMRLVGMGNQLAEEARYAVEALAIGEEKMIICGTDASAYGVSSAFLGLLQLMQSYTTFGDTTSIYGTSRASGKAHMDVGIVLAGASSADSLSLEDLDAAITTSDKRGGKGKRRIFLCSIDRRDEINRLLQPQQRFTGGSLEIEGGFSVATYKNIPIIGSRFMDKNGVTYNGSADSNSHADQAMYLLDLDEIFMAYAGGVNAVHTPIIGADIGTGMGSFTSRSDAVGGYYKSYGVLVMRRFDTQVIICNLTDI